MQNACEQVVGRVERGLDAVVEGASEPVRATLQAATQRLEASHGVVTVTGVPAGPLSLSALIAQLSGRGNLDDHDDSVLELGVRRLTDAAVPGRRTVLVLDAPAGLQRSAFRFLRQVGRLAPDLICVIASFPEMADLLAEPGMDALRERFAAATVFAAAPPRAEPAPSRALVPVVQAAPAAMASVTIPPDWRDLRTVPLSARAEGRRRRHAIWAATAIGMAASVALGAWLGARTSETASPVQADQSTLANVTRRPLIAMAPAVGATPLPTPTPKVPPVSSAQAVAPGVVASGPPPVAARVAPGVAARPGADVAKSLPPEMATAAEAPAVASAIAEASLAQDRTEAGAEDAPLAGVPREAATKARTLPRPTRLAPAPVLVPAIPPSFAQASEPRRVMSPRPQRLATLPLAPDRAADARRGWAREDPLDEEASRDAPPYPGYSGRAEQAYAPPVRYRRYDAPAPAWRGERALPAEGPYIGTYETGPYGGRVFRYEPQSGG